MTLAPHEFIRRFLLHVLPHGFHRIRHYGLLASSARKASIARARELLAVAPGACRTARTTRLAATLSLLWRTHDHHRDLRAMEPTPRATSRARINRAHPVVTRHGVHVPDAATPKFAAKAPRHARRQDSAKRAGYQPRQDATSGLVWRKISLTNAPPTPAPSRFRHHHNRAKLEIPIDHRRNHAGSCLGGFRTPAPCPDARPEMAGIRKPSPSRKLSGVGVDPESGR
jgi:hypothetical protein